MIACHLPERGGLLIRISTGKGILLSSAAVALAVTLLTPAGVSASRSAPDADPVTVDLGLESGFQDFQLGHFQRGRSLVGADFDLDGRIDFFVGNPGDESYILHNVQNGQGQPRFEMGQVIFHETNDWGATSFDYDNDGDYDIFVTVGGNDAAGPPPEGIGFNHLLQNIWLESGQQELAFVDVTDEAGVAGPVPSHRRKPIPVAGANATAADYDRDGWTDLFEPVEINVDSLPPLLGRNILWHNNGDGTFADVTDDAGLGVTHEHTRHSSWLDIENDGDLDLYENNYLGFNHLWRNRLVEDGVATFEDVTAAFSPPGENLACPWESFASAPTDFNNDGWQDLLVMGRSTEGEPPECPYPTGHAVFINQGGTGFVNIGPQTGIEDAFPTEKGVMGCQVGDVNADGSPDVYVGNGAPMDASGITGGQIDQLFLSTQKPGELPAFANETSLIDYEAPRIKYLRYPPYPYRTHGTVMADVDGDGTLEIAVSEGGPISKPDYVREPDRLFKFIWPKPLSWLMVRPVGDGVRVAKDGIGTRLALTVEGPEGTTTLRGTLLGGSCFSAFNGYDVYFGLGDADRIDSLEIEWPDGTVDTITEGLSPDTKLVVEYGKLDDKMGPQLPRPASDPGAQLAAFLALHPRPARPPSQPWNPVGPNRLLFKC